MFFVTGDGRRIEFYRDTNGNTVTEVSSNKINVTNIFDKLSGAFKECLEGLKKANEQPTQPVSPAAPAASPQGVTKKETQYIVVHHAAGDYTPEQINEMHKKNTSDVVGEDGKVRKESWIGAGYNWFIDEKGEIHSLRGLGKVGSHTAPVDGQSINQISEGICMQGNFENEPPSAAQLKALESLIRELKEQYPNADVTTHGNFEDQDTACPGKYFAENADAQRIIREY